MLRAGASLWRRAVGLSLPASCAGCGRWEIRLCPRCRELLDGGPLPVEHAQAAGDLEILAAARYAGPVRALVLGWKNGAREDLDEVMTAVGRDLGRAWAAGHRTCTSPGTRAAEGSGAAGAAGGAGGTADAGAPPGPPPSPPAALLVVPAPSGLGRRLRGRLVVARLADAVTRGIADQWAGAPAAPGAPDAPGPPRTVLSADILRRRGRAGAHQAGRSARQRRSNRAVPPRVLADVRGLAVVLVDDVVTTGATLGACARALREEGARVVGAVAVASTPPPAPPARGVGMCPPQAISSITKRA